MLVLAGTTRGAEYVVAPFIETAPPDVFYDYTIALRVYALPELRLVASDENITGLTTVSADGTRQYELNLSARSIRSFELPSLRLISDVPVIGQLPFFENYYWLRENPRSPGILMLQGLFWFDSCTGRIVETPQSLGISQQAYHDTTASISQAGQKLHLINLDPNASIPPFHRIVDLADPRQTQTSTLDGSLWMEEYGLVATSRYDVPMAIVLRDPVTAMVLDTIALPAGWKLPHGLVPVNRYQLLMLAISDDEDEQAVLRLDLRQRTLTRIFSERFRLGPKYYGYDTIEVRGNRAQLLAHSGPTLPLGIPPYPPSVGQLRQIDLTTGASSVLRWPAGGGPYTHGNLLAVAGDPRAVPLRVDAWMLGIAALLLLGMRALRSRAL